MNEMKVVETGMFEVNEAIESLTNAELKQRSTAIVNYMNSAQRSLFNVAINLNEIKKNKLYEEDGYKKFNDFCEDVLGYKHAMCNNLVRIAERFLEANDNGVYSIIVHDDCDYTVSQLQEVLKIDNDTVIEMDENSEIDPSMTTKEIRQAVKKKLGENVDEEVETEGTDGETTETEPVVENEFEYRIAEVSSQLAFLLEMEEIITDGKAVTKITNFKKWIDSLVTE